MTEQVTTPRDQWKPSRQSEVGYYRNTSYALIYLFTILYLLYNSLLLPMTGSDVTGSDVIHVTGSDVTGSDVTGSGVPGSDVSHVTGSDVTGGDVIFPMLFSYYSSRTKCSLTRKTRGY